MQRSKKIEPSANNPSIFRAAKELLYKAYIRRVSVRLAGIRLTNFSELTVQGNLFEDKDTRINKVLEAIDRLRNRYGFSIISFDKT